MHGAPLAHRLPPEPQHGCPLLERGERYGRTVRRPQDKWCLNEGSPPGLTERSKGAPAAPCAFTRHGQSLRILGDQNSSPHLPMRRKTFLLREEQTKRGQAQIENHPIIQKQERETINVRPSVTAWPPGSRRPIKRVLTAIRRFRVGERARASGWRPGGLDGRERTTVAER